MQAHHLNSRIPLFIVLVGACSVPIEASRAQAIEVPGVVAVSATSATGDSTSVLCLLDPNCEGKWVPGSRDSGLGEGITIRFEKPIAMSAVELVTGDAKAKFKVLLDGVPAQKILPLPQLGKTIPEKPTPGKETFKVLFAAKEATLVSLRIDSTKDLAEDGKPPAKPALHAVRFLPFVRDNSPAKATPLTLALPRSVKGTSAGLDLKLDEPVTVKGLLLWNGDQSTDADFSSKGRAKRISVKDGGGIAQTVELKDVSGPQRVLFPKPFFESLFDLGEDRERLSGNTRQRRGPLRIQIDRRRRPCRRH